MALLNSASSTAFVSGKAPDPILKISPEIINSKKVNNLIKKWANELSIHFPKEDIFLVNRYMKSAEILNYSDGQFLSLKKIIYLREREWEGEAERES